MLSAAFQILQNSILQFVCFFGLLFIAGLSLTWISKWTNNSIRQFYFSQFGTYFFGWIGIPVHELCHALFAKIFFHDVRKIKWFDPKGRGGSHGTVVHYYNDRNLYHRVGLFFIGMGPTLLVPVFLFVAYLWLVPGAKPFSAVRMPAADLATSFAQSFLVSRNWSSIGFYFFLYFSVCLTSQMELSSDDLKVASGGLLPIFGLLLAANLVASLAGFGLHSWLSTAFRSGFALWGSFFLIGLMVALANLVLCSFLFTLLNKAFGHPVVHPFRD